MVNFGLLAAKIGSLVWGTPANFNGFRVLPALLHGTLVVGVSQALRRRSEQRSPPIFDRAAITLGIGPHSSTLLYTCAPYVIRFAFPKLTVVSGKDKWTAKCISCKEPLINRRGTTICSANNVRRTISPSHGD